MEFSECNTVREQALWLKLRVAEAKIAELESAQRRSNSAGADGPRKVSRTRLSPDALRMHYRRCAARARLARAKAPEARRRVLRQARAIGALPDEFDEGAYLAGADPPRRSRSGAVDRGHADAEAINAAALLDPTVLLALRPGDAPPPNGDPTLLAFWSGLRFAYLDRTLDTDHIARLRRFIGFLPLYLAHERIFRTSSPSTLRYDDQLSVARGPGSSPTLWYPNGRALLHDASFFYPSGLGARAPGSLWYPNGQPFTQRAGWFGAPDGSIGHLDDLIQRMRAAAARAWPDIERGLNALPREHLELAVLEVAWTLLRRR